MVEKLDTVRLNSLASLEKIFLFLCGHCRGGFLLISVYLVSIWVWRNPLFPRGRKMKYDREGIEDDEESDNFDKGDCVS